MLTLHWLAASAIDSSLVSIDKVGQGGGRVLVAGLASLRRMAEAADALIIAASYLATRLLLANLLLRRRLSEQALRDPLTGMLNRRYFTDVLPLKLQAARRDGCSATPPS